MAQWVESVEVATMWVQVFKEMAEPVHEPYVGWELALVVSLLAVTKVFEAMDEVGYTQSSTELE